MSDIAIRVEGLGKEYRIGKRERYKTLRDTVSDAVTAPVRWARSLARSSQTADTQDSSDLFWALKDVSFEVPRGAVVGIIGRNGAGKSTLLKILSRITEPTEGRVEIHGRVGSLLEVGTGFHPELTGRENILLNGAILGMRRAEISRKFDEIVAFAEIERFLDTPVKHYSSGMYVRLAFAVAAHLEPEILIVDEVLAVGDAEFQKKCLGKMQEASRGGRTVLFVSHNMGAIRSLCTSALLLKRGQIRRRGAIDDLIKEYNGGGEGAGTPAEYMAWKEQPHPHFRRICLTQNGQAVSIFRIDQALRVEFEFDPRDISDLVVTLVLRNSQGVWVHHSTDEFAVTELDRSSRRRVCQIPPYALAAEEYFLTAALTRERYGELFEKLTDVARFQVAFTGKLSDRTQAASWKGTCGPGLLAWE